nr:MDR family MFS transporter [Microvirga antarctica]
MDQSTPQTRALNPPTPLTQAEIRSIIIGLMVALLLAALDQTIIATALPTIGRELGDLEHLPWVVTSYLLTATVATPLYGKFSDAHGRRITLLIGISVFIIGSIACALAPSMLFLILARGLQGLGGGGLMALSQTIVADLVSPRERGRYQVYFASVFMTSSLAGPVLGGFFAEHLHWSMIFWINLPLGLLAFLISYRGLKRLPRHDRPHKLDWLGAFFLVVATVSILLALSWGGLRYAWVSLPIAAMAVVSVIFWGLFGWRMKTATEPLIPAGVLQNPVVRMGVLAACFGMGTYIGLTIYLPVYFETVRGLSASHSGLALIPLMVGTVMGANISGQLMAKITHYKRVPIVGLSAAVVGVGVLVFFERQLSLTGVELVLGLLSIGLGTLLPVSTVSIQNAVRSHELGTATGVANFFRSIGGAFVVAIFGAIILGMSGIGGISSLEALGSAVGRNSADLAQVFHYLFVAALVGFSLSLFFLIRMKELPLKGSAVRAAEAAIAD